MHPGGSASSSIKRFDEYECNYKSIDSIANYPSLVQPFLSLTPAFLLKDATSARVLEKLGLANNSELNMEEYLAELGAGRWGELDNLTEYEWWENVESLALSIEAARMWEQARGDLQ
jgi:hypothetical protein